jgi:uncharacterized Zn-binding protein involved in type VI secretion
MATVAVNPPKTPVTKGSSSIAAATVPNICKMPGPPAPFVPTPLPNIGKSDDSPKDYSTSVKIEGNEVAIKGATFGSMGDIASKGTGGGLISANTQGPTAFIGPGSMDVKIEGKNVQYLGDPMMNNCGPSGSAANAATLGGVLHVPTTGTPLPLKKIAEKCHDKVEKEVKKGKKTASGKKPGCQAKGNWKHKCCADEVKKKKYKNVKVEDSYGKPHCRLDVAVVNPPGSNSVTHIFDFKFNCTKPPSMAKAQRDKYEAAFPKAMIEVIGP